MAEHSVLLRCCNPGVRKRACWALGVALSLPFGALLLAAHGSEAQANPDANDSPRLRVPVEPRLGGRLIRGITVGPIESALHPDQGYGSETCGRAMAEASSLGANWVSITPFGRVWDLAPTGISLTFEQQFAENRGAVLRAVEQAHRAGLRVMLVPHLWVEIGDWRGEIDPPHDDGWRAWQQAYRNFLMTWADVAQESGVDMLAVGVELRSWVTTARAPLIVPLIRELRSRYSGLVTYAGNWDDIEETVILGELDVIGINAFYPLSQRDGASVKQLLRGGRQVVNRVRRLAQRWQKPVMFTEFGYTTRRDPAVRPWEWPEHLRDVAIDEEAQAAAYWALLAPFMDEPWFAGFFVWRIYSNPEDVSQEREWGFSPRGKLAELVLRDAFAARWAADDFNPLGHELIARRAKFVAHY